MLICILSDSHDHIPLLCAAVADAKRRGAEAVLHCGDIVAPSTLAKLQRYELPVHAIHGNNTGDLFALSQLSQRAHNVIQYYGQDAEFSLAGRKIFLVHYPHYARALACTGNYDVVCCGHTHQTVVERVPNIRGGHTVLVNPGTVGGVGGVTPTYVLGNLTTLEFQEFAVPESAVKLCLNTPQVAAQPAG